MRTLANSLLRIWSAKDRVPHLTGWGRSRSQESALNKTDLSHWVGEGLLELVAIAQRTAPTVVVVALNIFR